MDGMRRTLVAIFGAIAALSSLCWFFVFAYADWLRFSSPLVPDDATGQVVFEKAVKGAFYITHAQAQWVKDYIPLIWFVAAASLAVVLLAGGKSWTIRRPEGAAIWWMAGIAWAIVALALLFFGDYVMSLMFTGSLTLPDSR